jgi:hypothetical protein
MSPNFPRGHSLQGTRGGPPPGNGYAGGAYYDLEFTNLSGHACTLHGYPGVPAVSVTGRQLGSPAGWGRPTTTTVTLSNGATATAKLDIADTGTYTQCFQRLPQGPGRPGILPTAAGLRVYPPNQTVATFVPYPLQAFTATQQVSATVKSPTSISGGGAGYSGGIGLPTLAGTGTLGASEEESTQTTYNYTNESKTKEDYVWLSTQADYYTTVGVPYVFYKPAGGGTVMAEYPDGLGPWFNPGHTAHRLERQPGLLAGRRDRPRHPVGHHPEVPVAERGHLLRR